MPATLWASQTQAAPPDEIAALSDSVFEAANDVARLRTGDAILRAQLSLELEAIREALRDIRRTRQPRGTAALDAVRDIAAALEGIRLRARGAGTVTGADLGPTAAAPPAPPTIAFPLPPGLEFEVRLLNAVSPDTSAPPLRVEAATPDRVPLGDGRVLPAGTLLIGTWRPEGTRWALVFTAFWTGGVKHPISATAVADIQRALAPGALVSIRVQSLRP